MSKRYLLFGLCFAVLAFTAGSASADTVQSFSGEIGTTKPGRGTSIKLTQKTENTDKEKQPTRVVDAIWRIPGGAVIDSRGASFCTVKKLQESGKCSSKSKIGSGKAVFDLQGSDTDATTEVTAYNAAKAKSGTVGRVLLHLAYTEGDVKEVIEGEIKKLSRGAFSYEITFKNLPTPTFITGVNSVLSDLSVTLKASRTERSKGKRTKYNYFTSPATCSGRRWYFEGELELADGAVLTPASSDSCKNG